MKFKRYIAAVLAAGIMTAAVPSVFAARFTDIHGHWAEATITDLAYRGIVNGISETEFNPDGAVTRAEFLKMTMEATGIETVPFRAGECLDADADDWFAPYLQSAVDKGLVPENMVAGYNLEVKRDEDGVVRAHYSGAFNGNLPITREEMAVIVQYMYQYTRNSKTTKELKPGEDLPFTDADDISGWAHEAVKLAYAQGFVDGMDTGAFEPKATLTRAESATIINRIITVTAG